jgi:polar amino acid transport system permease protein
MLNYQWNWDVIWRSWDKLAEGLLMSLTLAVVSLLAGVLIGLLAAYARALGPRWLAWPVAAYVELVRNVPLLLLVFFLYFGLPEFGIFFLDNVQSFMVTLSIYAGAYLCEVFRAGLSSLPRQYVEAARAIGLRPWQRQRYVVLPVMLRITLPAISNNLISLFKDTSLATAIAVQELTFVTRQINANFFRPMEAWLTATAIYLVVVYAITIALRVVERRYASIR